MVYIKHHLFASRFRSLLTFWRCGLFCVLTVALFTPALSQETLSGIQRELTRVEREIEREKKLHNEEKTKSAEFEKRKAEKEMAVKDQIKSMNDKISLLNSKHAQLKKQRASLKAGIKSLEVKRQEFGLFVAEKALEAAGFFKKDFPYQREKRAAVLEDLATGIKSGAIEPEEAVTRFFAVMEDAISMGYDAEVYSGTYRTNKGKVTDGRYLRLGTALMAFNSLDGKVVAYLLETDSAYAWVDEDLDLATRQNIKKAIGVAEGKSAPELVNLPFSAPRATKGGQ